MPDILTQEVSHAEHPRIAAFYEQCGYSGGVDLDDKVLAATCNGSIVGAVRLCSEDQDVALRGLYALPGLHR